MYLLYRKAEICDFTEVNFPLCSGRKTMGSLELLFTTSIADSNPAEFNAWLCRNAAMAAPPVLSAEFICSIFIRFDYKAFT
ncbi:hypothetical protein EEL49_12930 [Muribaculaceae bacterium Isolate-104 (HZI)]|nr:hypothetical protein EEL49_12930 [Muribaculaceae bacterium Isolate-104 (HZI)]